MITMQMQNIENALQWIKTCPFKYAISSMQGGFVHIEIFIDTKETTESRYLKSGVDSNEQ